MSELRAVCCKCGRKRVKSKLRRDFLRSLRRAWNEKWYKFPRSDSWRCITECLEYAQEVQLTEGEK